jgi:predicted outer membrane repeat protein
MNVADSTFVANQAEDGGAIFNAALDGDVLPDIDIHGNSATQDGGGVYTSECLNLNSRLSQQGGHRRRRDLQHRGNRGRHWLRGRAQHGEHRGWRHLRRPRDRHGHADQYNKPDNCEPAGTVTGCTIEPAPGGRALPGE